VKYRFVIDMATLESRLVGLITGAALLPRPYASASPALACLPAPPAHTQLWAFAEPEGFTLVGRHYATLRSPWEGA